MSTENIRIMTWNVRGFNTHTKKLREEIIRQSPHIIVLKETMTWIFNDDVGWAEAIVLNMEAIKQVKGRRGGLEVIISPEL